MDAPPRFDTPPEQRFNGWDDWNAYNASQRQRKRPVRPLCLDVIAKAGPGEGRTAWDIGAGAGLETHAFRLAGWRVQAVELEADSAALIGLPSEDADAVPSKDLPEVQVHVGHVATVLQGDANGTGPTLTGGYDLLHASFSLPYLGPIDFPEVWAELRRRANPGAWVAVDLFGDRDSFVEKVDVACYPRAEVEAMFHGLTVVRFTEDDEDSGSWSGTKHGHVFSVIARNDVA